MKSSALLRTESGRSRLVGQASACGGLQPAWAEFAIVETRGSSPMKQFFDPFHHLAHTRVSYAEIRPILPPRFPLVHETAGKELARLHVEYESLDLWPLERIETKDVPWSEQVVKMKLSPDKRSLWANESLTLAGIPPETFDYRLGSRSALDWIIDQYQIKGESDPNREDDPGYIIRLVGQVVRVSIETQRIVQALPAFRPPSS
jgi:predicted helicase